MGKQRSTSLRFIDLFAGLGGFHLALNKLGHQCVFASEIDESLCKLYEKNFSIRPSGNLRKIKEATIPAHDILCAGFPCQPFSKAGEQKGTKCKLWGDLFSKHVLRVIKYHRPTYLLMENVANLERHNGGDTWKRMRKQLQKCGYSVDTHILSPKDFGIPQIRERLFIVGCTEGLDHFEWPEPVDEEPNVCSLLDPNPVEAKQLTPQVLRCLETWQDFLDRAPKNVDLPSFPIWTMEFGATYPFTKYESLYDMKVKTLRNYRGSFGCSLQLNRRVNILPRLPSYARNESNTFPVWKQNFIRQNRKFYQENKVWIKPWLPKIREFPPSLQKFEWNCKGEDRDIWKFLIQFRASGVRVKRPITAPSLVAMTTSQVPIVGWEKRYMTPRECSRLQSMDELKYLPETETGVAQALGNAVNVDIVRLIAEKLCLSMVRRSVTKRVA